MIKSYLNKAKLNKAKLNNLQQNISSKQRDVKLANVNKVNEKQLKFVLSENKQIDHVYAVKGKKSYEIAFSQNERSVYVKLEIPKKLILDVDDKFDIYFSVNGEYFRPFLEIADTMPSDARHFDIIPGVHRSGYIYFSKNYKRAMLQIKQMEDVNFNNVAIANNTINLFFDKNEPVPGDYQLVLERWGHYVELQTNWMQGLVTADLTENEINKLVVGFEYSVRMINKNNENVPVRVNVKNIGDIQIAKNNRDMLLPFEWVKMSNLKEYTPENGKTYLCYPSEIQIDSIYLEYRERQIYKKIEFEKQTNGWISLDVNIQEVANLFKEIHVIYETSDLKIVRGYNDILKIQNIKAFPDILNVVATSKKNITKFTFETEINVISVSLNEKEDGSWHKQMLNKKLDVYEVNSQISSYDSIIIEYVDENSYIQTSISKVDDIYVEIG